MGQGRVHRVRFREKYMQPSPSGNIRPRDLHLSIPALYCLVLDVQKSIFIGSTSPGPTGAHKTDKTDLEYVHVEDVVHLNSKSGLQVRTVQFMRY